MLAPKVASQRAAECLPLVMEPESKFYNSPLVVLDFQSLYPSVMIAYNYWYVHYTLGLFEKTSERLYNLNVNS